MATYYHSNGGGGREPDWGSWIPIVVLFCIPTPVTWVIAFFWLVNKLRSSHRSGSGKKSGSYGAQNDIWDWEVEDNRGKTAAGQKTSSAHSSAGKKTTAGTAKASGRKKPE